jgi:predicted naringenin-chalcone synthase
MSLWIGGLGTAVPPQTIVQQDAADMAQAIRAPASRARSIGGQAPDDAAGVPQAIVAPQLLTQLYRRSGVAVRHSVVLEASSNGVPARQSFFAQAVDEFDDGPTTGQRMRVYQQQAGPLACEAAAAALDDAGMAAGQVTHLITVSCSGFYAPGYDVELMRELRLSPRVARTHVGFMGCHGVLNALRVARAFTDADPCAGVLVCALELCSLHYHYRPTADKLLANALFADGAAALVARGGLAAGSAWSLAGCGAALVPDSADLMSWSIGDHGFEMSLSPRVPEAIRQHLRPWLADWLAEHALSPDEIGSWAIHPGGPKILTACAEAAGLVPSAVTVSREVLHQFGNMSSATVLFVLDRLRRQGAARPCVALGFGPGLAMEAALFR